MFEIKQSAAASRCWPAIVAAARSCVGTRFRPQGRTPGLGLDCVGVALIAAAAAGMGSIAMAPYSVGGDHDLDIDGILAGLGCRAVLVPMPGDVLVIAPAPRKRHLAVMTPAGVVHAQAGIGRVVEGPIDSGWSIVGAWRLPGAR